MKKKMSLMIMAIMTVQLTACGSAQTETTQTTEEATRIEEAATQTTDTEDIHLTAEHLAVIINDTVIQVGTDMNDYLDALGDPDDYSAAQSCTGSGEDKVYTYGTAYIYTNPVDGGDIIYLIEIEGDETTVLGIRVGSSREEMLAAYGTDYAEDGDEYLYTVDGVTAGFELDGDEVTFIEIYGE